MNTVRIGPTIILILNSNGLFYLRIACMRRGSAFEALTLLRLLRTTTVRVEWDANRSAIVLHAERSYEGKGFVATSGKGPE